MRIRSITLLGSNLYSSPYVARELIELGMCVYCTTLEASGTYQIDRDSLLGRGRFEVVKRARLDGQIVAVKILRPDEIKSGTLELKSRDFLTKTSSALLAPT
ncbi:hypothetical protein FRB95_014224 [Tulasnella sp. JGI-2019a]|nr:hypothetical protein FRB95_014224 [Tulasnella sp. JGI-2019a]